MKQKGKAYKRAISLLLMVSLVSSTVVSQGTVFATDTQDATGITGQDKPYIVQFDEAASIELGGRSWRDDALPIGNGHMGAMIFGGIATERVQMNEKTLWSGGPGETAESRYDKTQNDAYGNKTVENAKEKMEAVIDTAFDDLYNGVGKGDVYPQLDTMLPNNSHSLGSYQNFAEMYMDFDVDAKNVSNYIRNVNLKDGTAGVKYTSGGVDYARSIFANYPSNVMVMKLEASQAGKLNFTLRPEIPDMEYNETSGNWWGGLPPTYGKRGSVVANGDTITLAGEMVCNDMKFEGQYKVILDGGSMQAINDPNSKTKGKIKVKDAQSAIIIIALGTDYKNEFPLYRGEDPHIGVTKRIESASKKGYDALYAEHMGDFGEIFSRVKTDLGGTFYPNKMTDDMRAEYGRDASNHYAEELQFQYGRYLLLSSSREGSLAANLQGVWNDEAKPMWWSDYHTNINLEMNYWPTYLTNMKETGKPLVDLVDSWRKPGRISFDTFFGKGNPTDTETPDGWLVNCTANAMGFTGNVNSPASISLSAPAWLSQNLWEAYTYTGDKDYLKNMLYPIFKEEALMYKGLLRPGRKPDGSDKDRLYMVPSYSPEHSGWTIGSYYDQQLIWELFKITIEAAEILGLDTAEDKEFIDSLKEAMPKLHPVEIGASGQIKEWQVEDEYGRYRDGSWIDNGEKGSHRHFSNMVGLYPGTSISADNQEQANGAKYVLNARGDGGVGWASGLKVNCWARLREGERAYVNYRDYVRGGVHKNLFNDVIGILQLDGNSGTIAGVGEMLLQSHNGYIEVLPAIPQAWGTGSYKGLVARGNFEISSKWSDKKVSEVTVLSNIGNEAIVKCDGIDKATVTDSKGNNVAFTVVEANKIKFATTAGETYSINVMNKVALTESLKEKLKEAKLVDVFQYTYATAKAVETAITATETVIANENSTQEELSNTFNVINNAINGLVLRAPEQAYIVSVAKYTSGLLKTLSNGAAKDTIAQGYAKLDAELQKENIVIADADTIADSLMDIIQQNVTDIGDKKELLKAIGAYPVLHKDEYTIKSFTELTTAFATANELAYNYAATQADIDKALEAYNKAKNELAVAQVTVLEAEDGALLDGDLFETSKTPVDIFNNANASGGKYIERMYNSGHGSGVAFNAGLIPADATYKITLRYTKCNYIHSLDHMKLYINNQPIETIDLPITNPNNPGDFRTFGEATFKTNHKLKATDRIAIKVDNHDPDGQWGLIWLDYIKLTAIDYEQIPDPDPDPVPTETIRVEAENGTLLDGDLSETNNRHVTIHDDTTASNGKHIETMYDSGHGSGVEFSNTGLTTEGKYKIKIRYAKGSYIHSLDHMRLYINGVASDLIDLPITNPENPGDFRTFGEATFTGLYNLKPTDKVAIKVDNKDPAGQWGLIWIDCVDFMPFEEVKPKIVTLEAEDGALLDGDLLETPVVIFKDANASGGKYVERMYGSGHGSGVRFDNIGITTGGNYKIKMRYTKSNYLHSIDHMRLYINGVASDLIDLPITNPDNPSDFKTFGEATFTGLYNLKPTDKIEIKVDNKDPVGQWGLIWFDNIQLEKDNIKPPKPVITVDKSYLETAYTTAKAITNNGYTPESWTALQTAISNAKAIIDDVDAKQLAVDLAEDKLENAMAGIKMAEQPFVNKVFLRVSCAVAKTKVKEDYTKATFDIFKTAYDTAISLIEDRAVSQETVNSAVANLNTAMDSLVKAEKPTVDKSALESLYNANKDKLNDNYTTESWDAFQTELAKAKVAIDKADATQAEVDTAKINLQSAIDALVENIPEPPTGPINKADLTSLIAYAKDQQADPEYKYVVPAVRVAFENAIQNAVALIASDTATQAEVDNAYTELLSKVWMLEYKGNSEKLAKLVAQVQAIKDLDRYTPATVAILQDKLGKAVTAIADGNILQNELDVLFTDLQNALFGLRLIPNKDSLNDLINSLKAIDTMLLTPASASTLNAGITSAVAVFTNENATQAQIDAEVTALNNIKANLEYVKDDTATDDKAEANDKTEANDKKDETTEKVPTTNDTTPIFPITAIIMLAGITTFAGKKIKEK